MPVEEPALSAGRALLEELREEIGAVRWVRPEGLHVTVHFFGPLPEARWDPVVAAVEPACAAAGPFDVRLDRLGAFPAAGPPRVVWIGATEGREAATALVLACRSALAAAGVEVESREPAIHCTLGRPRGPWDSDLRHAWQARTAPLPAFTARRVVLFESRPGPGGSTYAPRREAALGSP